MPCDPWWKSAVIYQIYPRSFQDTDNDGAGDLRGIMQRLPYLVELGVDAIWISPIFPSPMADFGYDVSSYLDIDPLFGTLADFDALVAPRTPAGSGSSWISFTGDLLLSSYLDREGGSVRYDPFAAQRGCGDPDLCREPFRPSAV
jgi:hypothetical protein